MKTILANIFLSFFAFSTAFAGINLVYPGASMNADYELIPQGSYSDNTVLINEGGENISWVYGAKSESEDVFNNTVTISKGDIRLYYVFVGFTSSAGNATNNSIVISGGEIFEEVVGGYCSSGNATNNRIIISGDAIIRSACGGFSYSGNVTNNRIVVSGGEITVWGAKAGFSYSGAVTGNSILISGGKLGGDVCGGSSDSGAVTGNSILISGGEIVEDVCGGSSHSEAVTGNSILISGGEIVEDVCGGSSHSGAVTGNSILISGGKLGGDVWGGSSHSGAITGNSILVSGGTINGSVCGGKLYSDSADSGAITGNTIRLSGGKIKGTVSGGTSRFSKADIFRNNKLILDDYHGSVKNICNFEYIYITVTGQQDDMLILTGGETTNLSNTKINVTFTSLNRNLNIGDKLNILRNDAGILGDGMSFTETSQKGVKGVNCVYDLKFGADANSLYAIVVGKRSKDVDESRVSSP